MASSSRIRRERKQRVIKITALSVVVFAIGWYMLFVVSRSFKPVLGNTFHILVGCVFMAVSALVILVTLKHYFFPKRKKRTTGVVFLEDELLKEKKKEKSL